MRICLREFEEGQRKEISRIRVLTPPPEQLVCSVYRQYRAVAELK